MACTSPTLPLPLPLPLTLTTGRTSVRIMIMATMPERSSTIASELMMENQWIWSSPMYR